MNDLLRELAPISADVWRRIDEEAARVLRLTLAARRVVDFAGPLGIDTAAINLGRSAALSAALDVEGVEARMRRAQPLIEIRAPFELSRKELEAVARGAPDPDFKNLDRAARAAAVAEDRCIFHGYPAAGIAGIAEAAAQSAMRCPDDNSHYPGLVAAATNRLRHAGVTGPYALVLSPASYTGLVETAASGGYPLIEHVRRLVDEVVWAPGIDGGVVLSLRGGDFQLTVGRDFSIGYLGHADDLVRLYVEESFTFRVLTPEAAVPLVRGR